MVVIAMELVGVLGGRGSESYMCPGGRPGGSDVEMIFGVCVCPVQREGPGLI
jgi:hypothetical protein